MGYMDVSHKIQTADHRAQRRLLRQWRNVHESRDARIITAIDSGLGPVEISRLMGVSRMHIYRTIARREQQECHQQQTA
jgi:Mor family transcriptional regulator